MKIKERTKTKDQRIHCRNPGDVVSLLNRDGTHIYKPNYYLLVLKHDNVGTHIFNLSSNQYPLTPHSTLCDFYPDAELSLD